MQALTFKKEVVIEALSKNLAEHQEIYAEAVTGYREHAYEKLALAHNALEEGEGAVPINVNLEVPCSHAEDYKTAQAMLDVCEEEEVTFTQSQFQCYMLDKWGWQTGFLDCVSGYSMTAMRKISG